jgi:hypothetical protein
MRRQESNDQRLRSFASAETIAFVCECADEDCRRTVLLSPVAFISRRKRGELVLYAGHEPLADAPMAGERDSVSETTEPRGSGLRRRR